MDKKAVENLLDRYRTGNCTEAERQLAENWIIYGFADSLDLKDEQLLADLLDIRLRLNRDLRARSMNKKHLIRKWLPYAAAIACIVSVGIWLYSSRGPDNQQPTAAIIDVTPGGNNATLTLADGRTISLRPEQEGIVTDDRITYLDGTAVVDASVNGPTAQNTSLLQLTTPKGGIYRVTLADGTRVWLNAASTLKYPSQFTGDERVIELTGEAYLEVTKDQNKPFKVNSKGQELTVLGTAFNVCAYDDDPVVKTTLVTGSVRVASTAEHPAAVLSPGQQSTVSDTGIMVDEIDVSVSLGWKNGYFIFDGLDLREAIKQLSRWYDVEVIYKGSIPRTPFYGKISRDDTLGEVLDILREGKVNFEITKRGAVNQLIVMP